MFKGDFDGDGTVDCVSWQQSTSPLEFHKGLGGGAFDPTAVSSSACVRSLTTYAVADFDGDGKDDLVLVAPDPDGVDTDVPLLPGQADGTFTCPGVLVPVLSRMIVTSGYPTGAVFPVAADFTGDGFKDLLLVGFTSASFDNYNQIVWGVLGGGQKAWSGIWETNSQVNAGALGKIEGLSASDVNGDRILDVTTQYLQEPLSGPITPMSVTFYGQGDGTFVP